MRRFIQSLSPSVELAIVVLVAFGYVSFISVLSALGRYPQAAQLTDPHLIHLLIYELVLLAVLLTFLRLRGWTIERFGIRIGAGETLIGFALAGAAYAAYVVVVYTIYAVWPRAAYAITSPHISSTGVSLATVIAVSIINPVFEEVFVCGYVIAALRKASNPWIGVHVSVAIRLLYHVYQGAIAAIGVVPFGLIMALWYRRTGRLWPVIVAHAVTDFAALLRFMH